MYRTIKHKLEYWKNKKDRQPLIIKGARQIGKTFSLKKFGEESFANYHYLNFEDDEKLNEIFEQDLKPQRIIEHLSLYLSKNINKEQDLLIFDEIQYCPRALTSLKYFNENIPELAICAAGSLLGLELNQYSFPVGKVEFLHMFPMSFLEFTKALDSSTYDFLNDLKLNSTIPEFMHSRLWDFLKKYFVIGGLPKIVETFINNKENIINAFDSVREKQENLILAYKADIAKHSGKQNSMHIERLWKQVQVQLSQEQNTSTSKFKFKNVITGIDKYERLAGVIDWLTTAGLILKVPITNNAEIPLSAYTQESRFKLFMFDIGILGAMAKLPYEAIMEYDYGTYKGFFAENFAVQEFTYSNNSNNEIYSWREKSSEVEFIRQIGNNVLPIEVKSGTATRSRSLKIFADKYAPPYRTIMSGKHFNIDQENKVYNYPLYLASLFPLN